jgi:Mg2+/citrate symporter
MSRYDRFEREVQAKQKFWNIVIVISITLVLTLAIALVTSLIMVGATVAKTVEKQGLKPVIERIWHGPETEEKTED